MRAFPFSRWLTLLSCLALLLPGCVESYMPEAISNAPNFLVVDGFITPRGVTTITLSRTYAIDSEATPPKETRATLYIEDEGNTRYALRESPAGTYTSGNLTLSTSRRYRLHIYTTDGNEYASDFSAAQLTPAIDVVSWQTSTDGLTIQVSTHDAANATRYYRWEYDETWEITPPYRPTVEYVGATNTIRQIVVPYPAQCWSNARSTDIKLDNTTRLGQDVVSGYAIRSLPTTSPLLRSRYSILVKQQALTQDEYNYWELLRKNTENIGTLFDPLPSQLTGNVRCLNNEAALALGYVGVHSLTEKRLFISRPELPASWAVQSGYESCIPPDTVFLDRPSPPPPVPAEIIRSAFGGGSGFVPVYELLNPFGRPYAYIAASNDCVDCRLRGTSVKPSYWP